MSIYDPAEPQTCTVLVLFRYPFLVAFWALYEPRNTLNSMFLAILGRRFGYIFGSFSGPLLRNMRRRQIRPAGRIWPEILESEGGVIRGWGISNSRD